MKQATLIVLAAVLATTGCNSLKWSPLSDRSRNVEKQLDNMLLQAQAFEQSGDAERAAELYGNVLSVQPGNPLACHRMAILLDQKGEFDRSDELFQRAIESGQNRAEILTDYGYSQYVRGDLKQAETMLRLALSEDKSLLRAHNNLGLVLSSLGRTENAMQQFALGGCTPEQAANNLQQVQRWRDDPVLAQATIEAAAPNQSMRSEATRNVLAQTGFMAKQVAAKQTAAKQTAAKQTAAKQVAKENAVPKDTSSQVAATTRVVQQPAFDPSPVTQNHVTETVVTRDAAEPRRLTPISSESAVHRNPEVLKKISASTDIRRVPADDDEAIVRLARAPE